MPCPFPPPKKTSNLRQCIQTHFGVTSAAGTARFCHKQGSTARKIDVRSVFTDTRADHLYLEAQPSAQLGEES